MGFTNVQSLAGGFGAWGKAGDPWRIHAPRPDNGARFRAPRLSKSRIPLHCSIQFTQRKAENMSISATKKAAVISGNRLHDTDSGSPEVQVAIISERITTLQEHFKSNPKDHHGRRGSCSWSAAAIGC